MGPDFRINMSSRQPRDTDKVLILIKLYDEFTCTMLVSLKDHFRSQEIGILSYNLRLKYQTKNVIIRRRTQKFLSEATMCSVQVQKVSTCHQHGRSAHLAN